MAPIWLAATASGLTMDKVRSIAMREPAELVGLVPIPQMGVRAGVIPATTSPRTFFTGKGCKV